MAGIEEKKTGKSRVQVSENTARRLRMRADFEDKEPDQLILEMLNERNRRSPMTDIQPFGFENLLSVGLYATITLFITLATTATLFSIVFFPEILIDVLIADALTALATTASLLLKRRIHGRASLARYWLQGSPFALPVASTMISSVLEAPSGRSLSVFFAVGTLFTSALIFYLVMSLLMTRATGRS